MFNPRPKTKAVRSERYKAFIRTKPCLACSSTENIQAAHEDFGYGTMGGKAPDIQGIPLCFECHRLEHQYGYWKFWKRVFTTIDTRTEITAVLATRCLDYINEFIANGGKF